MNFYKLFNKYYKIIINNNLDESKKIYPYFNFLGQINLLVAGYIVQNVSNNLIISFFIKKGTPEIVKLQSIILFISVLGFIIIVSHYLLEKVILRNLFENNN